MAAGMSKQRQYRIVYRELHKIQRELAAGGVKSEYKRGVLFGFGPGTKPGISDECFSIQFDRRGASNGECFLWAIASVHHAGEWLYFQGVPWMADPSFEKHGKPLILEHFKQSE